MEAYNKVLELAKEIVEADEKIGEPKHVKAESTRQRSRINEIKKLATEAKKDLMAEDTK